MFEMYQGDMEKEFFNTLRYKWLPSAEDLPLIKSKLSKTRSHYDLNICLLSLCWLNQVLHSIFRVEFCNSHSRLFYVRDKLPAYWQFLFERSAS